MTNNMTNKRYMQPIQGKHKDQDSKFATKYSCSTHRIVYYAQEPHCPLCDAERQIFVLRDALTTVNNQVELYHAENKRLRIQVDILTAMREALSIIDDNDMLFLKTVLYQWKIDRSIALKVTRGASVSKNRKRSIRYPDLPNGFIALPRDADPEGHACTSAGGLAMAAHFEEALNTAGSGRAMTWLVQAMAQHLPGATE